jgi:hypothetical protein
MSQEKQKLANKVFLAARDMGEVGDYLWSLREVVDVNYPDRSATTILAGGSGG